MKKYATLVVYAETKNRITKYKEQGHYDTYSDLMKDIMDEIDKQVILWNYRTPVYITTWRGKGNPIPHISLNSFPSESRPNNDNKRMKKE